MHVYMCTGGNRHISQALHVQHDIAVLAQQVRKEGRNEGVEVNKAWKQGMHGRKEAVEGRKEDTEGGKGERKENVDGRKDRKKENAEGR
jgi:hypothetical protein